MPTSAYRTNATSLTLDELLILDVIFDCSALVQCLRRESFATTFNSRFHNLDDHQLQRTIASLMERGILEPEDDLEGLRVRFSEHGGELWSAERCPVWERYATEKYDKTINGKGFVTIIATSEHTLHDFIRLNGPYGTWRNDQARVRTFKITRYQLIPWHAFPLLHVAVVMNFVFDCADSASAMDRIRRSEKCRTWWRNVRELQKFLPPNC